jgi:Tol biopolymer transport system component/DNA-binding winged helix-turn-helix (wHTH) protein
LPVTPQLVRFGVFELDLNTGELCKNGRKLKLQEQPFRLLSLLLEQPGQPVTRDRLKELLWSSDSFVDFDHSLNAAIAKLRLALGDSAENPRFVETLARRGYRFIAPVEFVDNSSGSATQTPSTNGLTQAGQVEEGISTTASGIRPEKRIRLRTWAYCALAIIGLLTVAGVRLASTRRTPRPVLEHITRDAGLTTEPAVSPDGRLVAYASDRGGKHLNLWIQQLDQNGKAVQITRFTADAHQPSFSPDGNTVVFRADNQGGHIYSIPAIGGEPLRLAPQGRNPRFSPDGKWIAYWVGPVMGPAGFEPAGELFVVPASGGEPRRLGSGLPLGGYPVWSPDGQSILVFAQTPCTDPANADWWTVPVNGGRPARTGALLELQKQGFQISADHVPYAWGWRDHSILFSAKIGDTINVAEAFLSNKRPQLSGAVRKLTSGTEYDLYPTPASSDAIVFASLAENIAVWALPINANKAEVAGPLTRLTEAPALESAPTLSRAGDKIAFVSARTRTYDLWLKDLNTGEETPGPSTRDDDFHPKISRDGKHVAFNGHSGMYVAALDSGTPKKISATDGYVWDWSPDGRSLLFRDRSRPEVSAGVSILDTQIRSEKVLVQKDGLMLMQASYSPTGRELLVEAIDPALSQSVLYVIKLSNDQAIGQWIPVGHSEGWEDKPRWSPDGNAIYFISHRDGFRCIWVQRLDAVSRRPVAPPFPVRHFHETRLGLNNVGLADLEMDVAKDKIVFNLGELKGNIWRLRQ